MGVELGDPLGRACNDNGDGGVCTHCGKLHTATVVKLCPRCDTRLPASGPDRCWAYPMCVTPDMRTDVDEAIHRARPLPWVDAP